MYIQAETPADLGRYLRDVRESLQLDVQLVTSHLHIRPRYLQAIESGQLSELPGSAYTRGYIIKYASYLGLDKDKITDIFDQVSGEKKARQLYYVKEPTRKENMPGVGVMALGVAIIALAYGIWYAVQRNDIGSQEMVVDAVPDSMRLAEFERAIDMTGNDCFGYHERFYPLCYPMLETRLPQSDLPQRITGWLATLQKTLAEEARMAEQRMLEIQAMKAAAEAAAANAVPTTSPLVADPNAVRTPINGPAALNSGPITDPKPIINLDEPASSQE